MSRSKHTEAQIIGALKQIEAGRSTEDVAREHGVSKHTVYAWKAKLGVIDRFTRQCLALEVATSFPSRRVTRVLERAIAEYGKPQSIRSDNGPELTSRHCLTSSGRSIFCYPAR